MATDLDQDTTFDPNRRLCPDGNCVGVIGPDGRCNICAITDADWCEGSAPAQEKPFPPNQDPPAEGPASADKTCEAGDFDPGRRLCSDGSCIGVIAGDNCCTVCGKTAVT